MRLSLCLLAAALGLAACAPGSADETATTGKETIAVHPDSGLRVINLSVSSKGKTHHFRVEVAESRFEQAKGLMFRRELGPDEGMLFPMDPPREASFWMKNTVIGLDIIFIGADRRILNIAANAIPYDETALNSDGIAAAVLEIPGGRAAELGIMPGDKVNW
jgi:uncharacterized membrane protein (UPF0127 family)